MSEGRPRVFYGWWVVLTAALGLFWGSAPIIVFSFGIFLKSLSQEFHSGRAVISLAFTFHNLMSAISAPLAGQLVDSYGARKVILPCTLTGRFTYYRRTCAPTGGKRSGALPPSAFRLPSLRYEKRDP
ncbi:MAG TPA: hypothetical protein VMW38_08740 [Terriglobia bacterium]|nr:hypothetical protein [Terriglobia bacterium]